MAQLGRVGITDVGQIFHSLQLKGCRRQRRLEYATMAAALDCLVLGQGLEPALAGRLVRAAPQLLWFPGRAAMLFEGLGQFGVAPPALARGMFSFLRFADMANWADYSPTAKMLDQLLRDEGGLAVLLKERPASRVPALYQLPEGLRERLDYLCGRMPVWIQ